MRLEVEWAGLVDYQTAWERQKAYVAAHEAGEAPDRLLLLEHPPTFTLGRSGDDAHLLFDDAALATRGITVHRVDRGGDITYHGPGQLVGYPVLDLRRWYRAQGQARPDLHDYLRRLEALLIDTLAAFGLDGWRFDGYTGVWVSTPAGPRKIAAIGVRVNVRGVTSHGFALNVDPNLEHFNGIVPCGIVGYGVTSLSCELGRALTVDEVRAPLVAAFASHLATTGAADDVVAAAVAG